MSNDQLDQQVVELENLSEHREIVTFMRRSAPLNTSQRTALEQYGHLILEYPVGDLRQHFEHPERPLTVEIGFGMGRSLVLMAKANPERNFVGIEVHTPGVGHLLHLLLDRGINNVRVMNSDAVEIIQQRIPIASLDRVQLYFPDPWHKKRHNKRRIVQPEFVSLLASRLKPGGIFHMATDWEDYAQQMATVMQASPDFHTLATDGGAFSPRPDFRPLTKFEQRGLRLGHGVWDLLYTKA